MVIIIFSSLSLFQKTNSGIGGRGRAYLESFLESFIRFIIKRNVWYTIKLCQKCFLHFIYYTESDKLNLNSDQDLAYGPGNFDSFYCSPDNWYSVEFEVNSNGKIIDGINHCYTFGKVNDETIFWDNDFPCQTFSSPNSNDDLPYLGGSPLYSHGIVTDSSYEVNGTVRIRNFEWLEGVTMPRWLEEVIIPRFPKIDSNRVPIDIFYGK